MDNGLRQSLVCIADTSQIAFSLARERNMRPSTLAHSGLGLLCRHIRFAIGNISWPNAPSGGGSLYICSSSVVIFSVSGGHGAVFNSPTSAIFSISRGDGLLLVLLPRQYSALQYPSNAFVFEKESPFRDRGPSLWREIRIVSMETPFFAQAPHM